ncbi:hypothetical protein LguiA_028096 [Lonicera macranthoides]
MSSYSYWLKRVPFSCPFSFHLLLQAVSSCQLIHGRLRVKERFAKRRFILFASSKDLLPHNEVKTDDQEQDKQDPLIEDKSPMNNPNVHPKEGTGGKPGLVSFYNHPFKREADILVSNPEKNRNNLLWFVGPAVLVASFIFPSLYLRRILSTVFEDSLLTGKALFLMNLWSSSSSSLLSLHPSSYAFNIRISLKIIFFVGAFNRNLAPQLEYRITSVAVLVLSLVIPMVTMGLVWPWTGPAASATLAPYLVGIVVQFAFEQYAKYTKSPSWPVIPVIFQVYRLHQLNRAAQLVTALSFTVRGAEMTSHNLAINSSLGTLLNVLQCLGVICIWSLSSFLMRFLPSAPLAEQ